MWLIVSDLHFTAQDADSYRWQLFPWMKDIIKRDNVSRVLCLGDITDAKDKHPASLVNRLVEEFHSLSQLVPVHILKGNHDYIDSATPFFRFLDLLPNITFITEPTFETIDDYEVLWLPHTRNYDSEWNRAGIMKEMKETSLDFIFTHQCYEGAEAANGYGLGGVPPAILGKDRTDALVLAGDIHKPQKVQNIEYIGSPYPIHFGDEFKPRGLLLDPKTRDLTTRKHTTLLKITVEAASIEDMIDQLEEVGAEQGDHVRVRYYMPRADFYTWADLKQEIYKVIEKKYKLRVFAVELHAEDEKKKTAQTQTPNKQSIASQTNSVIYGRYCEHVKPEETIKSIGSDIVKELEKT